MRHSSIFFLALTGLRLIRGGIGSLKSEIAGSEARIFVLGIFASVVCIRNRYLNLHSLANMLVHVTEASYFHA